VAGERALRDDDQSPIRPIHVPEPRKFRDFLKNSTAGTGLVVELARAHPGCLGARLTGGGFGGATINPCRLSPGRKLQAQMSDAYEDGPDTNSTDSLPD